MGRRSKEQVPTMRHDKERDRAYVRIDGVRHRLGKWGSDKAQVSYDALIASWLASGRVNTDGATAAKPAQAKPAPPPYSSGVLTVADLLALWMEDIATNGKGIESSSYGSARAAGRAMSAYLTLPVDDFGPKVFKQVMRDYAKTPVVTRKLLKDGTVINVERPRTRKYVNSVMVRIRKMFQWAVTEEMIDAAKAWRLQSVPLLEYGDPHAKESDERQPAKQEVVQATLGALTRECAALIEVLSLTGCRPSEVCRMTMDQIYDRGKKVWRYVPRRHKNSWRGKIRHVAIGPRCQKIIEKQVEEFGLSDTDAIFSPRRSVPRKKKFGSNPDPRAKEFYGSNIVRKAVARACEVAGVEHWFPYQMRYAVGAKARQQGGIATTSATLGNSKKVAAHYAPEGFEDAEAFAEANG